MFDEPSCQSKFLVIRLKDYTFNPIYSDPRKAAQKGPRDNLHPSSPSKTLTMQKSPWILEAAHSLGSEILFRQHTFDCVGTSLLCIKLIKEKKPSERISHMEGPFLVTNN